MSDPEKRKAEKTPCVKKKALSFGKFKTLKDQCGQRIINEGGRDWQGPGANFIPNVMRHD